MPDNINRYTLEDAKRFASEKFKENELREKYPTPGLLTVDLLMDVLNTGIECGYKFGQKSMGKTESQQYNIKDADHLLECKKVMGAHVQQYTMPCIVIRKARTGQTLKIAVFGKEDLKGFDHIVNFKYVHPSKVVSIHHCTCKNPVLEYDHKDRPRCEECGKIIEKYLYKPEARSLKGLTYESLPLKG